MPISPDAPNYLTVDEAATLLRVNPGTIRNRIRKGELPAKRIKGGKAVLVDQRDVLALLEDAREGLDGDERLTDDKEDGDDKGDGEEAP